MNKFTIFTIIFSISVITVTADLVMRDYYGKNGEASIITSDPVPVISAAMPNQPASTSDAQNMASVQTQPVATVPTVSSSAVPSSAPNPAPTPIAPISAATSTPATAPVVAITAPGPTVTGALVQNAGFLGDFQEQPFSGKLYELLDITKTPIESVGFYQIADNGVTVASVTEIALRDEIRALQLYSLLQNKTKPYIDLSLNETNAYGDHSFYINHAKKQDEAFLTVKIGRMIYGFAYVKSYHQQIKKLIQLLSA